MSQVQTICVLKQNVSMEYRLQLTSSLENQFNIVFPQTQDELYDIMCELTPIGVVVPFNGGPFSYPSFQTDMINMLYKNLDERLNYVNVYIEGYAGKPHSGTDPHDVSDTVGFIQGIFQNS